jgi:steroid delta-isomerase-like uncharacterized protein
MADDAEKIVRRWFDEVWNNGKESAIDELMADGAVYHGLGEADIVGPEAFKPFYRQFRTAFPDMHITVEHAMAQGDTAAARCTVTATHTGPGLVDSVTSKPVRFTGMVIARVNDGKVAESWNNFDFLTLYQQLGMKLT